MSDLFPRQDLHELLKETFDEVEPFWQTAGIPVYERYNVIPKIKKLLENYKALLKTSKNTIQNDTQLSLGLFRKWTNKEW